VYSRTYLNEARSQRSLFQPVVDTTIDRRSRITHDAAASALGSEVHIDGEEVTRHLALLSNHLPLRDKRLAACGPRRICGIDTARVEAEGRTIKDCCRVQRAAWVGIEQADERRLVEIRHPDVSTRCAAVFVVYRGDVNKAVFWTSRGADGLCQSGQSKVRRYDWSGVSLASKRTYRYCRPRIAVEGGLGKGMFETDLHHLSRRYHPGLLG
jgi:hypothetical protein